jgi:hypothetical protein
MTRLSALKLAGPKLAGIARGFAIGKPVNHGFTIAGPESVRSNRGSGPQGVRLCPC